MCCYKKNGKLDVSDKVVSKTIELTKELMKKYNIDINHVIRHYDVSHKVCPAPFVNNINRWNEFKAQLNNNAGSDTKKETEKDRINSLKKALNKDFKSNLALNGKIEKSDINIIMSHYLKYFTKGEFVYWVQEQLVRKGYDIGSYGKDKCYGHDMEKAVLKYQKDKKLTQDKCVGIEVVKSLVK